MKGYKGSNKRMNRNYVVDISGKLKEKVREKSRNGIKFQTLTYEELVARNGTIVYVLYPNGTMDRAVVLHADDNGFTLWGTYDLNGDAIIGVFSKKHYGGHCMTAVEVGEPLVIANETTLRDMNFPESIVKTILKEIANDKDSNEQIPEPEDND